MIYIKKTLIILTLFITCHGQAQSQQQKDISLLVKDLTYLIQVAEQLQRQYGGDQSKIRFNYPALIAQLKSTRAATQEYLNQELYELHTAPPAVYKPDLTKVKP